jgi:hypothetical protein
MAQINQENAGSARAANARNPQSTQLRHSGVSSPVLLPTKQIGPHSYASTEIARWPGAFNRIPRKFYPNLGSMGGARNFGFSQENSTIRISPPNVFIGQLVTQQRTLRNTSQRFNQTSNGYGIPAVFVATSSTNNRNGYSV